MRHRGGPWLPWGMEALLQDEGSSVICSSRRSQDLEAELTYPHNVKQGLPLTKKHKGSPPRQAPQTSATWEALYLGAQALAACLAFGLLTRPQSFPPCQPYGPSESCSRIAQPHQRLPDSCLPSVWAALAAGVRAGFVQGHCGPRIRVVREAVSLPGQAGREPGGGE